MNEKQKLLLECYIRQQNNLEEKGVTSKYPGDIIQNHIGIWCIAGGIHIGILIACLVIFANFIVFNVILHFF